MTEITGLSADDLPLREATEFLYSLEKFGVKMDLDNIVALMRYAGDVHRDLKVVHVAGTNGKGSTCAMITSVLTAQGYKVGLYTSPHIVSFTERIKINGVPIPSVDLVRLTGFFRDEITRLRATFFEATTAIMFKYFAEMNVDYAVVETGLGGRLDATNVVYPLVSVITGISFDHMDVLGDTLEKIAFEKAGIIKRNRPVVVNVSLDSLRNVFSKAASGSGSRLFFVEDVTELGRVDVGVEGSEFQATVFGKKYDSLRLDLGGRHQIANSLTALLAIHLLGEAGVHISQDAVYRGLASIKAITGHRGRLEVISRDPFVILDVAHNPDGIKASLESLGQLLETKRGTILFAVMRDKDAITMLNSLRDKFTHVILTQLKTSRSMGANDLKKLCNDVKLEAQTFNNSTDALRAALSQTDNDSFLLITGSHYLAGEVLPVLDKSVIRLESL